MTSNSRYISNTNIFLENAGECSREFEIDSQNYKIQRREDYIMNPPSFTNMIKGEERFRRFLWYMHNGFWKPHKFQESFIELAVQVLSESIVGQEDWPTIGPLLIEEYGWDMSKNNKILLGAAPRRFGKSIVQAMLITAGALIIPNLIVAVFTTGQRISTGMGKYIKEALEMSGNSHRIISANDERIQISGDSPSDIRTIYCYPSNPKISEHISFLLPPLQLNVTIDYPTLFYPSSETIFNNAHPPPSLACSLHNFSASSSSFITNVFSS